MAVNLDDYHDIRVHNVSILASKKQIIDCLEALAAEMGTWLTNYYSPISSIFSNPRYMKSTLVIIRLAHVQLHPAFVQRFNAHTPRLTGFNRLQNKYFQEKLNFSFAKKTCADHEWDMLTLKPKEHLTERELFVQSFKRAAALTAHLSSSYRASRPIRSASTHVRRPVSILKLPRAPSPPGYVWDEATGRLLPPSHQRPKTPPPKAPPKVRFQAAQTNTPPSVLVEATGFPQEPGWEESLPPRRSRGRSPRRSRSKSPSAFGEEWLGPTVDERQAKLKALAESDQLDE